MQKQINTGQQHEVAMLNRRMAELGRERERVEAELRSALQARTGRVLQLETKLREVAYRRPGERGLPRPAVMDSSMQLEAGSCLMELRVERLTLTPAGRGKVGDAGVFLTWIFYNQDMHFTPVVHCSGVNLRFACSSLYKLQLDSALVHYLAQDLVTIEVQGTDGGSECHKLGAATISCKEILDYPSNRLHGTVEVTGLGTLVYWFRADGALQEFLQTRGDEETEREAEREVERVGEEEQEASGAGDQSIVAGSPDICEPSVTVKPRRGPAAVSTPVRRRLAAHAAPAPAPAPAAGRHPRGASPRVAVISDTEATESEGSPERSARRPPVSRARSEADMGRAPPRPAARRQLSSRGGGGDASPPRRTTPAQAQAAALATAAAAAAHDRAQRQRRKSSARSEAETPRRPPRRESGGTRVERRESGRVGIERQESAREVKDRRRSGLAGDDEQRSPKPRPVGARLIRSGPAEPAPDRNTEPNGERPAERNGERDAGRGAERGTKRRPDPTPQPTQPPRPPPRTTGYATYTESSASEASSLEGLGRAETPPTQQQQREGHQQQQQQQQQLKGQQQQQQQQQHKQQPIRGRQLQGRCQSKAVFITHIMVG